MTNLTTQMVKDEFARRDGIDHPAALEDVLGAFSREDFKTVGEFSTWLEARPHLVAATAAKQKSSKTVNPWTEEGWNLGAQGAALKSDAALAASLAKSAGSFIGATKPGRSVRLRAYTRGESQ
jgi:hypothetical protein